ncbi:MAG: hypothetical protein BWY46_02073 [Firmicutes bacterium ADurb.Bin300]|nr:MAG: hypothetical protein BWY46_02073 [Firmicutes bacterium ADurb.Bin300]
MYNKNDILTLLKNRLKWHTEVINEMEKGGKRMPAPYSADDSRGAIKELKIIINILGGKHMNKQNTMPEIKEGDLIKLDYNDADHCDYYQFFDVRKLTVESCERLKNEGAYGEDPGRLYLLAWYCNRDSFVHFVDDEKDSVTAIYRKINKDYICIWEKEGNT